jgi:hypothetical protein
LRFDDSGRILNHFELGLLLFFFFILVSRFFVRLGFFSLRSLVVLLIKQKKKTVKKMWDPGNTNPGNPDKKQFLFGLSAQNI